MIINNKINDMVGELISLTMTKGVQPHELCEAIFDEPYTSITSYKAHQSVITEVSFLEEGDDNSSSKHSIKYTYSLDATLLKIEQKVGNSRLKLQWSRESQVNKLISDISNALKALGNKNAAIQEFIATIPDNSSNITYLKEIA